MEDEDFVYLYIIIKHQCESKQFPWIWSLTKINIKIRSEMFGYTLLIFSSDFQSINILSSKRDFDKYFRETKKVIKKQKS